MGADLIGEIHSQRRRRTARRVMVAIIVLIVLALLGVVAKLLWDRRQVDQAVEQAAEQLAVGTPKSQDKAREILEGHLHLRPEDPDLLVSLALLETQAALLHGGPLKPASAAVDTADTSDAAEWFTAKAMLALAQTDIPSARDAIATALQRPSLGIAPGHPQWFSGMLALAETYSPKQIEPALTATQAALDESPQWIDYHRAAIALQFRGGDLDKTFHRIELARNQFPTHLGIAGDEAFYSAMVRRELEGVEVVARDLLENPDNASLGPRDRARAALASAIGSLHDREEETARRSLQTSWDRVPDWDLDTRDLIWETTTLWTRSEQPSQWLEQLDHLPPAGRSLYRAWLDLANGNVTASLKSLAKLPQDQPRVAYLTALALVEQGRWNEAAEWLPRAQSAVPGRIELDVAAARLQAQDPEARDQGIERLRELSKAHPHAPRVWTGLGIGLLARTKNEQLGRKAKAAARKQAQHALEQALELERKPAEAAFRLAQMREEDAHDAPELATTVLELYERAADTSPRTPKYRAALADYLMYMGRYARAERILRELAETEDPDPQTLLTLAEQVIEQAMAGDNVASAAPMVETWLDRAEDASPRAKARLQAHLNLARETPEALTQARERLEQLLDDDPRDLEARLLHIRTLLAQDDEEAAKESIRVGIRRTRGHRRGRLYILWARLDARQGAERRAARRAWSAWRRLLAEHRPARELLRAARFTTNLWLAINQPNGASKVARGLTKRVPYLAEAWVLRGRVELAAEDPATACTSAAQAVELDADEPSAHGLRGDCLAQTGQRKQAAAAYKRAIELAKGTGLARIYRRALRRL